jgi:hypothetical protein
MAAPIRSRSICWANTGMLPRLRAKPRAKLTPPPTYVLRERLHFSQTLTLGKLIGAKSGAVAVCGRGMTCHREPIGEYDQGNNCRPISLDRGVRLLLY